MTSWRTGIRILTAAAALGSGAALAQEASFPSLTEAVAVPGQYIVKAEPGADLNSLSLEGLGEGVEVISTLPLTGALVIRLDEKQPADLETLTARALEIPGIAYIEPVYEVRIDLEPNDPLYPEQWALPRIGAPEVWDFRNQSGEVVAVLDTGIDYQHSDLASNAWTNPGEIPGNGTDDDGNGIVDDVFGANFVPATASGDPMDHHGHGTHVAGTIGAVADNGVGVAGTVWDTRLMSVKFLDETGSGTTAGAIRAIEYAIQTGADIINASWGGGGFSQALEDAISLANEQGILLVAAAGNAGADNDAEPHYPASYDLPNVLAVMATDENDDRAPFSNVGATSVDLAAPGTNILSTVPGGEYRAFSGTSMAAAQISGAAALIRAENPWLSPLDLKHRLMDFSERIPALAGLSVTGGRLNLAAPPSGPVSAAPPDQLGDRLDQLLGDVPPLRPSRAFGGPSEYPPDGFGGYGIVAFNGSPAQDRGRMFCAAFSATFVTDEQLIAAGIPPDRQMVTVWPVATDGDAATAREARSSDEACAIAVSRYGLLAAENAIADARRADLAGTIGTLRDRGPFLLAWAPGETKGDPDVLVLVADLSDVATVQQARSDFLLWKQDIQQNPELWERGWSPGNVRAAIRRWADGSAQALLTVLGLNLPSGQGVHPNQ